MSERLFPRFQVVRMRRKGLSDAGVSLIFPGSESQRNLMVKARELLFNVK
jgi:hypothetical protein